MAVDPDEAIEKLSNYRKEAKKVDKMEYASDGNRERTPETPIRQFFIHIYKFNAILGMALGFTVLLTGPVSYGNIILWFPLSLIAFGVSVQMMKTIARLNASDGRNTTIDDVFIIMVMMVLFFGYLPILPVNGTVFLYIHVGLVVLWFLQIFFVNYRKPEISGYGTKGGVKQLEEDLSFVEKAKQFFSRDRLYLVLAGFVLAFPLILYQYGII